MLIWNILNIPWSLGQDRQGRHHLKCCLQSWGNNHRGFTEDTERGRGKEREGSQGIHLQTGSEVGRAPTWPMESKRTDMTQWWQKQKWSSLATRVRSVMTHRFLVVGISWPTYISNYVSSHPNMPDSNVNWQKWIKVAGFCGSISHVNLSLSLIIEEKQ